MATIPLYPYGYKLNNLGTKEVEESRAEIVRLIYLKYLEGMNRYAITWNLIENKILRPRGDSCDWQYSMVSKILMDERYVGTKKYPPLLSKEIFDMAQEKRIAEKEAYLNKKPESCNSKRTYPFSGFIVCNSCGSKYIRGIQHYNGNIRKASWRCRNYNLKHEGKCNASGNIYEEILDIICVEAYNQVKNDHINYCCVSPSISLSTNKNNPLDVLISETINQMKNASGEKRSELQYDLEILIKKRTAMDWEAAPLDLRDFETEKLITHFRKNPYPLEKFNADTFKIVFDSIVALEPGKLKFILKNGKELIKEYKPMKGQVNNAKKHSSYTCKADKRD